MFELLEIMAADYRDIKAIIGEGRLSDAVAFAREAITLWEV